MKVKQKKGISLIVLVITIIVMIILAAAIILSLQGSGIIGKANEAKTKTNLEAEKEQVNLAVADALLKGDSIGIIENAQDLKESLAANGLTDATVTGDATNGYIITIGENVYEVSGSGNVVLSTTIRFTIDGTSYECEKGTTWGAFISTLDTSDGTWHDWSIGIEGLVDEEIKTIGYWSITENRQNFLTMDNDVVLYSDDIKSKTYTLDDNIPYIDMVVNNNVLPIEYIPDELIAQLTAGLSQCEIGNVTIYFNANQTFADILTSIGAYAIDTYTVDSSDNHIGNVSVIIDADPNDVQPSKRLLNPNNKYVSSGDLLVEGAEYTWTDNSSLGISFSVIFWDTDPHVTDDMLKPVE